MSSDLVPSHARWAFPASTASLTQYQYVNLTSTSTLQTPTATGVWAMVLDDAPALSGATISNDMPTGGFVVGAYYGCVFPQLCVQKVISGQNLTTGQAVMTDTSGHAVQLVAGGVILGYTIEASNSGDIVRIAPA